MAFASVAGRAGFVLELDKSQLDRGLPQAEQQFKRSFENMERTAQRSGVSSARNFDDLLASVRGMRAEADQLDRRLDTMGTGLDAAGASAGRFGAGLGGVVARAGLAGIAISSLYQGSQRLQESLQTTGAEAVTAEGKLRNFGSSLLRGDIVGAFQAIAKGPETFEDLGIAAKDAGASLEALGAFADDQGGKWRTIYDQARAVAEAYREMAAAAREVLNASTGFQDPQGNVIVQGGFAGLRPQAAPLPSFGTPIQTRSRSAVLDEQMREAQRDDDLQAQLRIAEEEARRARVRVQIVQRQGPLLEQRRKEEQDALDRVDAIQDRIRANRQQSAERRRQQAEQDRRERERAAEDARREREQAAAEAARALREGFSTREQELRNQYQVALGTPGRGDERQRASVLSAFFGQRSRDERLDARERAEFRSRQITFIAERRKDAKELADAAIQATKEERALLEQVLRNDVAAAELTEKDKQDDIRARRRLRDFYRRDERDTGLTAAERQDARGNRIAIQKEINDLLRPDEQSKTGQEIGALLLDFMRWQTDLMRSISNVQGGNLGMHVMEQLQREGNGHLARIATAPRRPDRAFDEAVMAW